jgi:hypothetical protein
VFIRSVQRDGNYLQIITIINGRLLVYPEFRAINNK